MKRDIAVDAPEYFCNYLWDGIHDVFYPSDKTNLSKSRGTRLFQIVSCL
jgi:hypothetical protein